MDIFISLPAQTLELFADDGALLRRYAISTATKGAGEQSGSYMTPRGKHLIRARIGAGCAENTVFVRRRPTGEIWSPELAGQFPGRDWILTRILWLSGRQPRFNRLGTVDTMRRYIYLHGSPDTAEMGKPGSIGCVRMRNRDIIELFDLVPVYTPVNVGEYRVEAVDGGYFAAFDPAGNEIGHVRGRRSGTELVLEDLAVLPEWRGREVATNLLRCVIERVGDAALSALVLEAPTHLVLLFSRAGFAAVAAPVQAGDRDVVRMRRSLNLNQNLTA